jgi:hypothetical protein
LRVISRDGAHRCLKSFCNYVGAGIDRSARAFDDRPPNRHARIDCRMGENRMNRHLAMVAATLAVIASRSPAIAESSSELVAKNLEARGGAEKMAAIKSVRLTGELRFPGDFRLAFSELRERREPGGCAVRIEATIQGLTLIQAYDGKIGWRVNPFQGRKDAEKMGGDEARALADECQVDGALLAAHAGGNKVDYLGHEDVDGTDAFKLRVAQSDGDEFTYYLDPDTYLEIKMLERRTVRGSEQETEYEIGDYERVAGVYFPFSIAQGPKNSRDKQVTTIDKGEANVEIAQGVFDFPAAPGAPAAASAPPGYSATSSPSPHTKGQ